MKSSDPRKIALDILLRVEEGAFADLTLDAFLSDRPTLDPRDRALATELVYGSLRLRGRLDFALCRFCRKPLAKVEPRVLALLRLGAYQLLILDRIPDRAAVHETVALARREGLERATGFINGILRALIRERANIPWPKAGTSPAAYLEQVLSLPRWLARRWLKEYGVEEAIALAEAMARPAPFTLRVNTLRLSREEYLSRLEEAGHQAVPTKYAPEGVTIVHRSESPLPGGDEGWFQVQDEASMLIAHLVAPAAGDRILDACAAPGGKTTHMAALCRNSAAVLALDLHPQRVQLVAAGAARLGCRGIEARPWDATVPAPFLKAESFDRVLVDAPCSGLGVLRRNPETRWRRNEAEITAMAVRQSAILNGLAPLVRPEGCLVYSLCTLTPEETNGVFAAFLKDHPDFVREDLRGTTPESWRELFDAEGNLWTFPHRHGGMDAFFAARFRKIR